MSGRDQIVDQIFSGSRDKLTPVIDWLRAEGCSELKDFETRMQTAFKWLSMAEDLKPDEAFRYYVGAALVADLPSSEQADLTKEQKKRVRVVLIPTLMGLAEVLIHMKDFGPAEVCCKLGLDECAIPRCPYETETIEEFYRLNASIAARNTKS
jgi:hypothetical protein